jgi:hypothetical protein
MVDKKKISKGARIFSGIASLLARFGLWRKGDKFAQGADIASDVFDQDETNK